MDSILNQTRLQVLKEILETKRSSPKSKTGL
jgi:hypothetical protein